MLKMAKCGSGFTENNYLEETHLKTTQPDSIVPAEYKITSGFFVNSK